jgi:hypothetical protein
VRKYTACSKPDIINQCQKTMQVHCSNGVIQHDPCVNFHVSNALAFNPLILRSICKGVMSCMWAAGPGFFPASTIYRFTMTHE